MSGPVQPPLTVETVDGATVGRPITRIKVTNGTLSVSGNTATIVTGAGGGGGSGTVTSITPAADSGTGTAITNVGTLTYTGGTGVTTSVTGTTVTINADNNGTVTGVSGSTPISSTGGATPTISIAQSDATTDGYLSGVDWSTFNNKQAALTLTTTGSSGAASLVGSTLNIPQYSGGGGGGTIGGSIASTQVARGATTANEIEGDNGLLFDGTSFTVNTLSTNDPILNISSNTKSITLTVNTSEKLTVKGSTNSFIFDASSPTGGITFPDGTTQTSASGTVGGSGALQQVATWSSSSALTGSTNLTFDGTKLYTPTLRTGGSVTTLGATDLTINTNEGTNSGSIVIADGVDGQISITPNGAGTIKLDGVELNNSLIQTGYVLKATSATAAGWAAESGGGGSPAGSNTEVQFNNSGAFGASSSLTFDGNYLSPNLVKLADGSNTGSFPYAIGFASDDDTGLYRSATNELAFSTGGGQVLTFGGFPKRVLLGEHTGATATSLSTYGTQDIVISTNQSVDSGTITITDGVNGNISLTPNGTGAVEISGAYKLPTAVTGVNDYVLTAQTDGSTAWAASGGGGGVTFPLEGSAGTVTSPTYSFSSESNTGMYFPAAAELGFSVNGVERMKLKNNALEAYSFQVTGTDTAATPGYSFDPDSDTGIFSLVNNTLSLSTGSSERLRVGTSGEILIGGSAAGTSGQVFTSGGPSAPPTWETPSGGGSGLSATEGIPQVGLPTTGSNLLQFPLLPIYNNSTTSGNGVVSATNTEGALFQFFGHQTGTIQSLTCETFGAANKMQLAVYSVDSNNLPSTRVGDSAEWDTEADGIHTVDLSGLSSTISITKGDMYYLGLVIKEGTARPTLRIFPTSEGYSFNIPSNSLTTETMSVFNRALQISGLTASTWPSSLTTANLTGVTNFIPNIGVVY